MQTGNHLAAIHSSQRPGILTRRTDAVIAVTRDSRVIPDEGLDVAKLLIQVMRKPRKQNPRLPLCDDHRLLESLPHRVRLRRRSAQSCRHRSDALALSAQQKSCRIQPKRLQPFRPLPSLAEANAKLLKLPIQLHIPF